MFMRFWVSFHFHCLSDSTTFSPEEIQIQIIKTGEVQLINIRMWRAENYRNTDEIDTPVHRRMTCACLDNMTHRLNP